MPPDAVPGKPFAYWVLVVGIAQPEVMADLGYGVMDDAMVEAAAYCLIKH